jgi:hypothetical protein
MQSWLDQRVAELRARLTADDEGGLWLLLFDDPFGEPILAAAFDGAMWNMDAQLTRNLAMIIREVPAKSVLVAIPRSDGRPRAVDLHLWRELRPLVGAGTELADLVVVGPRSHWSARSPASDTKDEETATHTKASTGDRRRVE